MSKIIAFAPRTAFGCALLLAAFASTALSPIARAADIVFNTDTGNVTVDGFSNSNLHGVNVGVTYSGGAPVFKAQSNFSLLTGAAGINGTTDVVMRMPKNRWPFRSDSSTINSLPSAPVEGSIAMLRHRLGLD